jgi:hypothetical protein
VVFRVIYRSQAQRDGTAERGRVRDGWFGPQAQKASDVANLMGRASTNLGPARAELINMGLLDTPQHAYASFTVPHFHRFLLRASPTQTVPELRTRRRPSNDI